MSVWQAGAASAEMPVEIGIPMAGYADRTGPSTGRHSPLSITALALSVGDQELIVMAVDLVSIDRSLCDQITRTAAIDPASLLIVASHTHSGPAGISHALHPAWANEVDHDLRRQVVASCAGTIERARHLREDALLSIGYAETSNLACNRNDPESGSSSELTTISACSPTGKPLATIVHWPCHPTILGSDNRLLSADFPGALRSRLHDHHDPAPVLYLNGSAADISTRFTRQSQTPDEVERISSALADAARTAQTKGVELAPRIAHQRRQINLDGWSDAQLEQQMAELDNLKNVTLEGDRIAATTSQGSAMLRALQASPCRPRRRTVTLDAWQVGSHVIVAIPGELASSLGEQITDNSPHSTTVAGYANGYVGYVPDCAMYDAKTYEALASPWAPGSGETMTDAALALSNSFDE